MLKDRYIDIYEYSSLAQSVEHMTVNHRVVGSSPTGGANVWPLGQVVKTPPFHGDNMGSNPVGVTKKSTSIISACRFFLLLFYYSLFTKIYVTIFWKVKSNSEK